MYQNADMRMQSCIYRGVTLDGDEFTLTMSPYVRSPAAAFSAHFWAVKLNGSSCFMFSALSSDCLPPRWISCLTYPAWLWMTVGYLQTAVTIPQRWRFTATGNPVTPQLTNLLGAELFYNKVPVLKMRLPFCKSYKTEQPACANWTKKCLLKELQFVPVPFKAKKDGFHSKWQVTAWWQGEVVILPRPLPVGSPTLPSPHWRFLLPLHCTPNSGTQYPRTLATMKDLHGLILYQVLLQWEFIDWKIFTLVTVCILTCNLDDGWC